MTAPLLSIRGLSAVSELEDGAPILRRVSLDLAPGEAMGLVGESGAGKSTIAKALLGVLPRTVRITEGEILFQGRDLRRMSRRESRAIFGDAIALIPQDPLTALNPGRRIEAQLTDGLRLRRGMTARPAHKRALELLTEVGMVEPERVLNPQLAPLTSTDTPAQQHWHAPEQAPGTHGDQPGTQRTGQRAPQARQECQTQMQRSSKAQT